MPIQAFVFDAYGTLFDTQSVAAATEAAFPPYGDLIAHVWRQKQLEYTWLRSVMAAHADFETVTREALLHALGALAIDAPQAVVDKVCAAFDHLEPYPDARETLVRLSDYRLAILSNGSPAMLTALLGHAGFDRFFEAVVSAEPTRFYKPQPGRLRRAGGGARPPASRHPTGVVKRVRSGRRPSLRPPDGTDRPLAAGVPARKVRRSRQSGASNDVRCSAITARHLRRTTPLHVCGLARPDRAGAFGRAIAKVAR